jgi:hypothetical protein
MAEPEKLTALDDEQHRLPVTPDNVWRMRRVLRWGTYGKSGRGPLKIFRLCECDSEHLLNILSSQVHISDLCKEAIKRILWERIHRPARRALRIPFDQLGLYINDEDLTVRHVVKERLKRAR